MTKTNIQEGQLDKMFENDNVMLRSRITVTVQCQPTDMIKSLSNALISEMLRLSNYSEKMQEVEEEKINKYLSTLLWLRVNRVNAVTSSSIKQYYSMYRFYAVPVLFYQVLVNIGIAIDKDYNLIFLPEYVPRDEEILSPSQMAEVSDLLFQFPAMHNIQGMPSKEEGTIEFMALQHVSGVVTGYQAPGVHPVNAFLASFISQLEYNEITGMMHRIVYGVDADYQAKVSAAVRALTREPGKLVQR